MAEEEDQQDLQLYFDNLNKEIQEDDDEVGDVVLTIETQMDVDDKDEDDAEGNNGTIIMDADGNYYFQTSDKMVEVKPMKKESPVKKVPATVVTASNIRKMPSKADNKRKQTCKHRLRYKIPSNLTFFYPF